MTTITIVRPGGPDADGYPVDEATEFVEEGWIIAPRARVGSDEDNDRAQQVITGLTGYGPVHSDLKASDQVRIRGALWDVLGDVGVWVSPFPGAPEGVEATFEKVTG